MRGSGPVGRIGPTLPERTAATSARDGVEMTSEDRSLDPLAASRPDSGAVEPGLVAAEVDEVTAEVDDFEEVVSPGPSEEEIAAGSVAAAEGRIRRSVGVGLVWKVTGLIAIVMVLFGLGVVYVVQQDEKEFLASKADRIGQQLPIVLERALWNFDQKQAEEIVRSYLIDPDLLSIKVVEKDNVVVWFAKPDAKSPAFTDLTAEGAVPPAYGDGSFDALSIGIKHEDTELGIAEVMLSRRRIETQTRDVALTVAVVLLVLVGVVAALLFVLVRRNVSRPLLAVVAAADRIAGGDTAVELQERAEADEIGALFETFRELIQYMQEMSAVATRISVGDLGGSIDPRSERDVLGKAFHRMLEYLQEASEAARAISVGRLDAHFESKGELDVLGNAFEKMGEYLQSIADDATRISTGDLSKEALSRSDADVLGTAFQRMSEYLREMSVAATAVADGDLRREVRPKSANDALGNAFRSMRSLRDAMQGIKEQSRELASWSKQLRAISTEIASDAEQTSERVQSISGASNQISSRAQEVATSTDELSSTIGSLSRNTEEVMKVVNDAVAAVDTANETIAQLSESSEEIGEIIRTITAIVKQTNMLALNAEIEAARAGRAGEGFSVVASRVRDLAQQTAAFTQDIVHRVESIQADTAKATEATREMSVVMSRVQEISLGIAQALTEQSSTTNDIATRVSEAAGESEQVNRAIRAVAQVSRNAAAGADGVQNAAVKVADVSAELERLVGQFEI